MINLLNIFFSFILQTRVNCELNELIILNYNSSEFHRRNFFFRELDIVQTNQIVAQ